MKNPLTLEFWVAEMRKSYTYLDEGEIRAIAEIKLMMAKEQEELKADDRPQRG